MNYNLSLSAFIFSKSGVKIQKYDLRSAQSDDCPVDSVHTVGHSVPHHNQARKLDRVHCTSYNMKMSRSIVHQSVPQGAEPLPLPLRVKKAGRNHMNEEITPSSPLV
jgi:hypothetical protein